MAPRDLRQVATARRPIRSRCRRLERSDTASDGDVLWALTTGTSTAKVSADLLAWRASEVTWDAVTSIAVR